MSVLDVDVAQRFGRFELAARFCVTQANVIALIGHSGAGKSAVINTIAGLTQLQRAFVRVNGQVFDDSDSNVSLAPQRRRLGCVFQDGYLFAHMRVRANCMYGAHRATPPPTADEVARVVELLDLEPLWDRFVGRLSGGERQRVAMARALLSNPQMLLLDEPLAAVDAQKKSEVLPYLKRVAQSAQVPIVYVSHALDEVAALADHVVVMENGKVVASGETREVMARPALVGAGHGLLAGAVIDAVVAEHDTRDGLTAVELGDGQRLWLPRFGADVGDSARLRIDASDVVLALREPDAISSNNVLTCEVAKVVAQENSAYVDVQCRCADSVVLARITARSQRRLALSPGQAVFAIVKTVSFAR